MYQLLHFLFFEVAEEEEDSLNEKRQLVGSKSSGKLFCRKGGESKEFL